jgi:ribosomal protein S3AE
MAEKKRYIDVEAPILNSTMRVLGTPENLDKKTIKLDLTRKLRGKGLTIKLRIFNQEGKLVAIPTNMTIATSYIKRMLRKGTIYVEDSFKTRCADIRITIKPLLITRKKVSRAVRKNLRNTTRTFITEYAKEKDFVQLCNEILDGTMQKAMLPKLKKIYPLSFSDIRVIETKELEKIDLEKASIPTEKEPEDIQEIAEETQEEPQELKEENTQKE